MSGETPRRSARFLEWDTAFFGVRIATLDASGISAARWHEAVAWCRAERIECLYVLSSEDDRELHALAEAASALRVDERTTFAIELAPAPALAPDPSLRQATETDLPALRALAAGAHTDSRFWNDEHFPRERCAELYSIWIENSVRGKETVFVAGPEGAPTGYVTVGVSPTEASIGLIAVSESARGRGLGQRLTLRALQFARSAGRTRMSVVTQGRNSAARRLYESCGFHVESVEFWHHLWFGRQA